MNKLLEYPFPESALEKWVDKCLIPPVEQDQPFLFTYEGSTCRNGGMAFKALFTVYIGDDLVLGKPGIEIPNSEWEAEGQMCGNDYATHPGPEGEHLEEFILKELPSNFAGCLCYPPQINQKWKMVASTIHYYLAGKSS